MDTSFETTTKSVEWYTPPHIVTALGSFDLDPCAPTPPALEGMEDKNTFVELPFDRYPANSPFQFTLMRYRKAHDGLSKDWKGRVWMNPPYGREMAAWMKKTQPT